LLKLPGEIGNLSDLIKFVLIDTAITTIPPSIGRLRNLKELILEDALFLTQLPEEIGNLASLEILNLSRSFINSLPPTIGRLRNLKVLNLEEAEILTIGNLESLEVLNLRSSSMESIPGSIVNLANLKILNLCDVWNESWSVHMERLVGLRELYIFGTDPKYIGNDVLEDFLLTLVQRCPLLGNIDANLEFEDAKHDPCDRSFWDNCRKSFKPRNTKLMYAFKPRNTKLMYALECNAAKIRTPFGPSDGGTMLPKLWPNMLKNATSLFVTYRPVSCDAGSNDIYGMFQIMDKLTILDRDQDRNQDYIPIYFKPNIGKPDAIYWLLLDGRESFMKVLLDRNKNCNNGSAKELPS
jgi:hypothetical protein